MPIEVHKPSKLTLRSIQTRFALQRDDWNDHHFQTLYHLHYRPGSALDDVTYIGGVKILRIGQSESHSSLIREEFSQLGSEFASVGTSLDYYQRLNEIPEKRRAMIMRALNDVVAHPELINEFSKERGWEKSLFRDNREWREFLTDARALYEGNFGALADLENQFKYKPPGAADSIEFDFSAPTPDWYLGRYRRTGPKRKKTLLPERMIVLVGRNGAGKSTLLTRLAHVAFASPQTRATKEMINAFGKLEPNSIGFMRVITISYSAFDSFIVPGVDARDLSQITDDLERGEGRFVFCGLRDIVAEVRDDVETAAKNANTENDEEIRVDRRTSTHLKSVNALADEFAQLLTRIRRNDKLDLFEAALAILTADPSFSELKSQLDDLGSTTRSVARRLFLGWSTGHKIALHVIASLVANATPRSLILFDEPESHLHPPLTAALISAVRLVLTDVNAFCVVATHSPVLLQETLARHVRYVRRNGKSLSVNTPRLETFGENVGVLSYDSFGLTASASDYHEILDLLVQESNSIEEIETAFQPGLSGQARAYVLSKLAKERKEK